MFDTQNTRNRLLTRSGSCGFGLYPGGGVPSTSVNVVTNANEIWKKQK